MRDLYLLNRYRITDPAALEFCGGWTGDDRAGSFIVPSCIDRARMVVVASNAEGWDHVSVSRLSRCPNWPEMEQVAALFFNDNETAMQLHVPASDHINNHPYCLHWWRPHDITIPRPPSFFVGDKRAGILRNDADARAAAKSAMERWR